MTNVTNHESVTTVSTPQPSDSERLDVLAAGDLGVLGHQFTRLLESINDPAADELAETARLVQLSATDLHDTGLTLDRRLVRQGVPTALHPYLARNADTWLATAQTRMCRGLEASAARYDNTPTLGAAYREGVAHTLDLLRGGGRDVRLYLRILRRHHRTGSATIRGGER